MADPTLTGSAFARLLPPLDGWPRERMIVRALVEGNRPPFLATLVPVVLAVGASREGPALRGTVYVTPDFLGVGTDADWLRTPLTPRAAQVVVDALGYVLPSKKIADAIHAQAAVKTRLPYFAAAKSATATYVAADARTDARLAAAPGYRAGVLVDGHRKYVLAEDRGHPSSVIIYGGENPDSGAWPLQPYSWVHNDSYVDYSHGIRGVGRQMDIDGVGRLDIRAVLADPRLARLVSDRTADRGGRYRPMPT